MNKKVFESMLNEANNFSTGDVLVINFEGKRISFAIKSKSRWWIEAYCLTDNTTYRVNRNK